MNAPSYFEIQAQNPSKLKEFYEAVFGWQFEKADGLPIEYYRIVTESLRGGLLQRPAPTPPTGSGTNAFTISMEVKDFDATAEKILKAGGQIAMPKFAVHEVCWQGYFLDPDNNTFGLFQPDPNAK